MQGDALAKGGKSAQFGGASEITEFESDFIFKSQTEVCNKYGITGHEYQRYESERQKGDNLPDLQPVGLEKAKPAFTVTDRRSQYLPGTDKPVKEKVSQYPTREYRTYTSILDRILVKHIETDPDVEVLEDGTTRNRKTGIIIPKLYRQQNNKGIVISMGNYVSIGGTCFPLTDFVNLGDLVTHGEYGVEMFPMEFKQAKALCHSLGVDHEEGDEPFRIVRIQDVRGVEKLDVRVKLVTGE